MYEIAVQIFLTLRSIEPLSESKGLSPSINSKPNPILRTNPNDCKTSLNTLACWLNISETVTLIAVEGIHPLSYHNFINRIDLTSCDVAKTPFVCDLRSTWGHFRAQRKQSAWHHLQQVWLGCWFPHTFSTTRPLFPCLFVVPQGLFVSLVISVSFFVQALTTFCASERHRNVLVYV